MECPHSVPVIPLPEGLNRPFIANNEFSTEKESVEMTTAKKNTTAKKFDFAAAKVAARKFRNEHMDDLKGVRGIKITSCIPGKGPENITDDPAELRLLARAANAFGWGNEFCSNSQAEKCFGTLKPGAVGWPVTWKPTTTKSGPNAGRVNTFETVMFPKDAFVWATESGEPELDVARKAAKDLKKAKRNVRRANKELKAAKKATVKPVEKPIEKPEPTSDNSTELKALIEEVLAQKALVNELMAQNAQLIAALTAKSA